jgi:hypothetical protein
MMPRSILLLDLLRFLLVLVEDPGLGDRGPHVGDGDRETGTRGVLEPELLQPVEARGHLRLRVAVDEHPGDVVDVALAHDPVLEREVVRERLVEEEPAEGRLDHDRAVAVGAGAPDDDAAVTGGDRSPSRRAASSQRCRAGNTSSGNRPDGIRTLIVA